METTTGVQIQTVRYNFVHSVPFLRKNAHNNFTTFFTSGNVTHWTEKNSEARFSDKFQIFESHSEGWKFSGCRSEDSLTLFGYGQSHHIPHQEFSILIRACCQPQFFLQNFTERFHLFFLDWHVRLLESSTTDIITNFFFQFCEFILWRSVLKCWIKCFVYTTP